MPDRNYQGALVSGILDVTNVTAICINIRLVLYSGLSIKANLADSKGELVKDKLLFERLTGTGGEQWNNWKMQIQIPHTLQQMVLMFEFSIWDKGSGAAAFVNNINIDMGACQHMYEGKAEEYELLIVADLS